MDQRDLSAECGRSDTRDLDEASEPAIPDGDGGMLGRVLIYATIVIVGVAVLLWKHGA